MGQFDEYLVEGEKLKYTATAGNKHIGCTDRRLVYWNETRKSFKDIDYIHITSIEWGEQSNTALIVFGVISGIIGLMGLSEDAAAGLIFLVIGGVLAYLYYKTKKSGLIIHTEKDSIVYDFKGPQAREMVIKISKLIRAGKG